MSHRRSLVDTEVASIVFAWLDGLKLILAWRAHWDEWLRWSVRR